MEDKMADRRSSFAEAKTGNYDNPPYSRLFIVGSKQLTEEDFRNAFSRFGEIEEIWIVRDRQTGESKGVAYIKFWKTSEAARALEAMNGKIIGNMNRSIKVMVASSRDKGSVRDPNEEEKYLRLFVIVPKGMTDAELYEIFQQYGEIDYASVIKDKDTRESKGFAYVKFCKFSDAAIAFENCDKKFRAVFAEPRQSRGNSRIETPDKFSMSHDNFLKNSRSIPLPPPEYSGDGYVKLNVIVSPQASQDQLWRLFDIVPSMDFCQVQNEVHSTASKCVAIVVYSSPQWAAYAREKFHGFEYPPGHRLIVKPEYDSSPTGNRTKPDLLQLAETITQASNLIQAAGLNPDVIQAKLGLNVRGNESEPPLCNVALPDPKPLAGIDEETAARCFIVCSPQPPPPLVLRDVFSRFGSLIDVYMLAHRNCGYAKYATKESALNAIKTLHGCEIYGVRMKVLKAEERQENDRKRKRIEMEPA